MSSCSESAVCQKLYHSCVSVFNKHSWLTLAGGDGTRNTSIRKGHNSYPLARKSTHEWNTNTFSQNSRVSNEWREVSVHHRTAWRLCSLLFLPAVKHNSFSSAPSALSNTIDSGMVQVTATPRGHTHLACTYEFITTCQCPHMTSCLTREDTHVETEA